MAHISHAYQDSYLGRNWYVVEFDMLPFINGFAAEIHLITSYSPTLTIKKLLKIGALILHRSINILEWPEYHA
jgi:hypothetical protein